MRFHFAHPGRLFGLALLITSILLIDESKRVESKKVASPRSCRVATFNIALNRDNSGDLIDELKSGRSQQAKRLAEVIQRVRPDLLLLNELDYDEGSRSLHWFCEKYLEVSQNGQPPISFPHRFTAPVNTGVDSGLDLNGDGQTGTADDAFGYGQFPGQYGMALLSQYPIDESGVRTYRKFLWRDMTQALLPETQSGSPYYSDEILQSFRLSSKSHWMVPVKFASETIYVIAAHPTPPAFDGPEQRNVRRNHDEIRLIANILSDAKSVYDDQGRSGGLPAGQHFVVVGDLNADPIDGSSFTGAIQQLLEHPAVQGDLAPASRGAVEAAASSGQMNNQHRGDPALDTADFDDRRVGNLRVDYVLPSTSLHVVDAQVYWPEAGSEQANLAGASDHHLVWVDLLLPGNPQNDESPVPPRQN